MCRARPLLWMRPKRSCAGIDSCFGCLMLLPHKCFSCCTWAIWQQPLTWHRRTTSPSARPGSTWPENVRATQPTRVGSPPPHGRRTLQSGDVRAVVPRLEYGERTQSDYLWQARRPTAHRSGRTCPRVGSGVVLPAHAGISTSQSSHNHTPNTSFVSLCSCRREDKTIPQTLLSYLPVPPREKLYSLHRRYTTSSEASGTDAR